MTDLCHWLSANGSSCAELLGFVTGVLNVWLVTRQNIWSWPVGMVNAVLYMVVFSRAGLYSDAGLQVVYFGLSGYGWWYWWRGNNDNAPLIVTNASRLVLSSLAAAVVGVWLLLSFVTSQIPNAAVPMLDAALVSVSLAAQWMMTRKLLENWVLWIAVNVAYIGLFISRGLRLTAVLYTVFLWLALVGYRAWKESARRHASSAVPSPASSSAS